MRLKKSEFGCKVLASTSKNSLINLFDILHLERQTANNRRVWRNIVRGSTDSLLPFARTLYKRGKAKVANFDVHVRIKEKVAEFQITMDDLMGAHVMAGTGELYHEEPCLWFRKDTTTMEHAHKRPFGQSSRVI